MKKNTKRNLYKTNTNSDVEYQRVIKITIGVVLILALIYFITAILMGEIKFGNKKVEKEETKIQYEEIIAGQIMNRSDNEYYVLLFNFTDSYATNFLSLKDSYTNKEDSLPVYILDLEKMTNDSIVVEESKLSEYPDKPDNISDLKVSNPTLLKIKNHKVVTRISDKNSIIDFFIEN